MENKLYDRDFNLWIEQIVTALRNRDFGAMDWNNLLEEIEDMGKSEKRHRRCSEAIARKLFRAINRTYSEIEILASDPASDGAYKLWNQVPESAPPQDARECARRGRKKTKLNCKHWQVEVVNFRNRIFRLLDRSPSLKKYMEDIYPKIFNDAVSAQQIEFTIPQDNFIDLKQILEKDYFGN